jgi:hypothetical protein
VSTYRDDLEAAQARADAASAEAERLRKEVEQLKAPKEPVGDVPEVPIPERFNVTRNANELTVTWRWFRAYHVFLLFFAIAWDAFLLFWYFGPMAGQGGLIFQIFPIAHVAVGIGLTYVVLTGFLNRTLISVRHGKLRISHGPLPWRGNRLLARSDLRQLFVAEKTNHHTDKGGRRTVTTTWHLCAVLETGKELTLLKGLETKGQAQYLETTFEQHLGIEDRRVAGEAGKSA